VLNHSSDTAVQFLPPNVTSKIQPHDAGIITLNAYYRKRYTLRLLDNLEGNEELKTIDILDAIHMLVPV
jgi:hypothetical protein